MAEEDFRRISRNWDRFLHFLNAGVLLVGGLYFIIRLENQTDLLAQALNTHRQLPAHHQASADLRELTAAVSRLTEAVRATRGDVQEIKQDLRDLRE